MHHGPIMKPLIGFLAMVGVVGCGGPNPNQQPVTGTAANVAVAQNNDKMVVANLAAARCDQEERCNNIGPKQKFASREICLQQLNGSMGNELNAYQCPRGLESKALDRCMAAIRDEACETPFDTLKRYDRCRTSAICMN